MSDRKYYGIRTGSWEREPPPLEMLKKMFLNIFNRLRDKHYFMEALGYNCYEGYGEKGLWGGAPDTFIYQKVGKDLWPIDQKINEYDVAMLFTIIEFLYDYVSEADVWSHRFCRLHARSYDKAAGQERYREEINEMLKNTDYQLTAHGEIQVIPPSGLEPLTEETVQTDDAENIDTKIERAKSQFLKYNATDDDKKEAIRTIGDVLEYLQKSGIKLESKDEKELFNILNRFSFRHHNKSQFMNYNKEIFYDWTFYVMLSSLHALLKLKQRE